MSAQAITMSIKNIPNEEQEAIINCEAETLVVEAVAGSGKTSALELYAAQRPRKRMVYVAYNRSIKLEAESRFPKNVKCVTSHGLAFPAFGSQYQKKLGNPKAYHVAQSLDIDNIVAGKVLDVINNFFASTDEVISEEHASAVDPKASSLNLAYLVDYARTAWDQMLETSGGIVMPHDGYLKMYQLSKPVITADKILFDEAQDATPATLDIISRQRMGKVYVGDTFQQIYGYRGAVNALARIKADERLKLTGSFRFGAGIAGIATELLQQWGGFKHTIEGKGKYQTVYAVDRNKPHAILARTNGGLFAEAVTLLNGTAPFGFLGGIEGYRMDMILDTYYLWAAQPRQVRDYFIASFKDFAEMKLYGETLDDKEIKLLVKVVDEHRHTIPHLIEELKRRSVKELVGREIVLSTTHKMKGKEHLQVVMCNDFATLETKKDEKGREVEPEKQEINLLYVAITRSMQNIQLPETVLDWIARENLGHLIKPSKGNRPAQQEPLNVQSPTNAATTKHPSGSFEKWRTDMDAYFTKVRNTYVTTPEQAAEIAAFLQDQTKKFRQ